MLDSMTLLYVDGNDISEFEWGDIPPLTETVNLGDNNLVRIPLVGSHDACLRVRELGLHYNKLTSIEWGQIPQSVVRLYLNNNQIRRLGDLSHLTELRYIDLQYNRVSSVRADHLPVGLQSMDLSSNNINCKSVRNKLTTVRVWCYS